MCCITPEFNMASQAENAACKAIFYRVMVMHEPYFDPLSIELELGETANALSNTPLPLSMQYIIGRGLYKQFEKALKAVELFHGFQEQVFFNNKYVSQ